MTEDRLVRDLRGAYAGAPVPSADVGQVLTAARARRRRTTIAGAAAASLAVAMVVGAAWAVPRWSDGLDSAEGGVPAYAPDGDADPAGLVGVWWVTDAPLLGQDAWLRMDVGRFEMWWDCGRVSGAWEATGAAPLAAAESWDARCGDTYGQDNPFVWAGSIGAFVRSGDGWELRTVDGALAGRLDPPGGTPGVAHDPPTVPPDPAPAALAELTVPAPLPRGVQAAAPWDLVGRWLPVGTPRSGDPHVQFTDDGGWSAHDGCYTDTGRWALDGTGRLLVVPPAGPDLDIFACSGMGEYPPVLQWLDTAARVGFDGDVLVLADRDGVELGRFTPDPTRSPEVPDPSASTAECLAEDRVLAGGYEGWSRAAEDEVMPYVGRIDQIGLQHPGYQDIGVLYEPSGIQIWWSGPLPAELEPVLADARTAGLRIVHTDTPYGREELEAAMLTLSAALDAEGIFVSSMGPTNAYDGLQISGPTLSTSCALQEQTQAIALDVLGGMPVAVIADRGPAAGLVGQPAPAYELP